MTAQQSSVGSLWPERCSPQAEVASSRCWRADVVQLSTAAESATWGGLHCVGCQVGRAPSACGRAAAHSTPLCPRGPRAGWSRSLQGPTPPTCTASVSMVAEPTGMEIIFPAASSRRACPRSPRALPPLCAGPQTYPSQTTAAPRLQRCHLMACVIRVRASLCVCSLQGCQPSASVQSQSQSQYTPSLFLKLGAWSHPVAAQCAHLYGGLLRSPAYCSRSSLNRAGTL